MSPFCNFDEVSAFWGTLWWWTHHFWKSCFKGLLIQVHFNVPFWFPFFCLCVEQNIILSVDFDVFWRWNYMFILSNIHSKLGLFQVSMWYVAGTQIFSISIFSPCYAWMYLHDKRAMDSAIFSRRILLRFILRKPICESLDNVPIWT